MKKKNKKERTKCTLRAHHYLFAATVSRKLEFTSGNVRIRAATVVRTITAIHIALSEATCKTRTISVCCMHPVFAPRHSSSCFHICAKQQKRNGNETKEPNRSNSTNKCTRRNYARCFPNRE